jgi:hypothetical protein
MVVFIRASSDPRLADTAWKLNAYSLLQLAAVPGFVLALSTGFLAAAILPWWFRRPLISTHNMLGVAFAFPALGSLNLLVMFLRVFLAKWIASSEYGKVGAASVSVALAIAGDLALLFALRWSARRCADLKSVRVGGSALLLTLAFGAVTSYVPYKVGLVMGPHPQRA